MGSHECDWLHGMIDHIQTLHGIGSIQYVEKYMPLKLDDCITLSEVYIYIYRGSPCKH
jgi:hypothetical protein